MRFAPPIPTAVLRATLLAAIFALMPPVGAQVYKWTDSTGKTHYGDAPPEGIAKKEIKISAKSYDGPPQIDNWAEVIRRPSPASGNKASSGGLTMFTAVWCGPCKRAKAYLAEKGVGYRDVDIEASDANRDEFRSFGGGGVPLIIAGDKRMRGFSPAALDSLIAASR